MPKRRKTRTRAIPTDLRDDTMVLALRVALRRLRHGSCNCPPTDEEMLGVLGIASAFHAFVMVQLARSGVPDEVIDQVDLQAEEAGIDAGAMFAEYRLALEEAAAMPSSAKH